MKPLLKITLATTIVLVTSTLCFSGQKDQRMNQSLQALVEAMQSFNHTAEQKPSKEEVLNAINQLASVMEHAHREFVELRKAYPFLRTFQDIPTSFGKRFEELGDAYIKEFDNLECYEQEFGNETDFQAAKAKLIRSQKKVFPVVYGSIGHVGRCNQEAIETYKRELMEGKGNDHEWPLMLAETGDLSCVPALIAVLKRNPLMPNGYMICTRAHCLNALTKLAGRNLGNTDEVWEQWWVDYQRQHHQ